MIKIFLFNVKLMLYSDVNCNKLMCVKRTLFTVLAFTLPKFKLNPGPKMSSSCSSLMLLRNVKGCGDKTNDIVLVQPPSIPIKGLLIYFGGDIQDLKSDMLARGGESALWAERGRSLEDTALNLCHNPSLAVMVVRPSGMTRGTYSRYDNFADCSQSDGAPKKFDKVSPKALEHLRSLVYSVQAEVSQTGENWIRLPKILVGFSKGVVVLNQLLLELPSHSNNDDKEFVKSLRAWCWWDGGHEGRRNGRQVYVTDKKELEVLVNDIKARVDVRVTPYQVSDARRPWIGREEAEFVRILRELNPGCVSRELYFEKGKSTLVEHFAILDTVREKPIIL